MSHKIIGVIGAMESEVCKLQAGLRTPAIESIANLTFYCGKIEKNELVLVQSGVGKVNAARAAQVLIDRYHPDYIINTGIAGGVGDGLHVGDFVIGTELLQHDFDLTGFGYAKGYISGCGDGQSASVFSSDAQLIQAFSKSASSALPAQSVHLGRIASGDVFVADVDRKIQIKNDFSVLAVEMEGAAIAQVAVANGVPFIVIRAISDLADGTATESFETFEEKTATLSAKIVESCVAEL